MANAFELGLYPMRSGSMDASLHQAAWDIGASGAPTLKTGSDPGISITRASAGIYSLVFPTTTWGCPPILLPVTDTAVSSKVTAFSASAGTATIEFMDAAGAAVELASGDDLHVLIYLVTTVT